MSTASKSCSEETMQNLRDCGAKSLHRGANSDVVDHGTSRYSVDGRPIKVQRPALLKYPRAQPKGEKWTG